MSFIGEAVAVGEIIIQLVEVGRNCADAVERFRNFSTAAGDIYVAFSHEQDKLSALASVLTSKDKIGSQKSLFDCMDEKQKLRVYQMLVRMKQTLNALEKLVSKYTMGGSFPSADDLPNLQSEMLATQALCDALPDLERRDRWLQSAVGWTKKLRFTSGGKYTAENLIMVIRERLQMLAEEIDIYFWRILSAGGDSASTIERRDLFQRLRDDADLRALNLSNAMSARLLVLDMNQPIVTSTTMPSTLKIEPGQIGKAADDQVGRFFTHMPPGGDEREGVLVERRKLAIGDAKAAVAIQKLCLMLACPKDDNFRLPKVLGWYHNPNSEEVGLVFSVASISFGNGNKTWTLDEVIVESRRKAPKFRMPPLEIRFQLGANLAVALAKFHSIGWYHQGIHAHNIFLRNSAGETWMFDDFLIFGFAKTRQTDTDSYNDVDTAGNIFRHPDRWAPSPKEGHHSLHDLYSLGVLLLEIGLWRDVKDLLSPTNDREQFDITQWLGSDTNKVQTRLIRWTKHLSVNMGLAYTEIVVALLQAAPEVTGSQDWRTGPSQARLMAVIGGLRDIYAGLTSLGKVG